MLRHTRLLLSVAALVSLLSPRGFSADSVLFFGSLVAITAHSIWLKQANGALKFAWLPGGDATGAATLDARYKLGDQILAKTFRIERFQDDEETEWFDLEAKSVEYIRAGTAAELAGALGSPARRRKGNLLQVPTGELVAKNDVRPAISFKTVSIPDAATAPPDPNDPIAVLELFRALLRKYLSALPNFNADEASILYRSPVSNPPKWRADETLQSEASFQGAQETHRKVIRNGQPWDDVFEHLPPAPRAGRQHSLLRSVFDVNCASLEFLKRSVEAGTPVLVYRITSPPESCLAGGWGSPGERYYPGHSGEVAIAEADNLVRRLEVASTGYPKGYDTQLTETRATWNYVKIGEERHLLPVEVQTLQAQNDGRVTLSIKKFKNHRHFEGSVTSVMSKSGGRD